MSTSQDLLSLLMSGGSLPAPSRPPASSVPAALDGSAQHPTGSGPKSPQEKHVDALAALFNEVKMGPGAPAASSQARSPASPPVGRDQQSMNSLLQALQSGSSSGGGGGSHGASQVPHGPYTGTNGATQQNAQPPATSPSSPSKGNLSDPSQALLSMLTSMSSPPPPPAAVQTSSADGPATEDARERTPATIPAPTAAPNVTDDDSSRPGQAIPRVPSKSPASLEVDAAVALPVSPSQLAEGVTTLPMPPATQRSSSNSLFAFFSPFDALAASAKQRSVTSPEVPKSAHNPLLSQVNARPASAASNKSLSNLPPLPATPSVPDETSSVRKEPPAVGTGRSSPQDSKKVSSSPKREESAEEDKTGEVTSVTHKTTEEILADTLEVGVAAEQAGQSSGLAVLPDDSRTQRITIDLSASNDDLASPHSCETQPISRFKTTPNYSAGCHFAVDGLIAYATRTGKIRVIDPTTGSRVIQKVHSGMVLDMAMSPAITIEGQTFRRLASCAPGKLHVWQVPASFDRDDVETQAVLDIVSPQSDVRQVCFSPRNPNILACVGSTGLQLVSLDSNRSVTEGSALPAYATIRQGVEIRGLSFTSDGSAIAVLTAAHVLGLHSTLDGAHQNIYKLSQSALQQSLWYDVSLISTPASNASLLPAISSANGNRLTVFNLARPDSPACELTFEDSSYSATNFGHSFYLPDLNVLAISAFDAKAVFLCAMEVDASGVRIGRITKVPTEHPVIHMSHTHFDGEDRLFYLHPEGFDQIILNKEILKTLAKASEGTPAADKETREEPSETEVPVAAPALQTQLPAEATDKKSQNMEQKQNVGKPDKVKRTPAVTGTKAAEQSATDGNAASGTAAPQQSTAAASKSTPAGAKPSTSVKAVIEETTKAAAKSKASEKTEKSDTRERTAAEGTPEESRLSLEKGASSAVLSPGLTQAVRDAVQSSVLMSVKDQLEQQLIPEVLKAFTDLTRAVDLAAQSQSLAVKQTAITQIRSSVIEALAQQLPDHFAKIERQLPHAILPAVEVSVHRAVTNHFQQFEDVLRMTATDQSALINDVREIVMMEQMRREESTVRIETELQKLTNDMEAKFQRQANEHLKQTRALQKELKEMKSLLQQSLASQAAGGPSGLQAAQGLSTAASPAISVQQSQYSTGRPQTPIEEYEDMFLHALNNESHPLVTLIDQASPSRLHRVLPLSGPPAIGPATLLALCMTLSRDLNNSDPSLSQKDRDRLTWILSCIRCLNYVKDDKKYSQWLPRLFTDTMHALNVRKKYLTDPEDFATVTNSLHTIDDASRRFIV